MKWAPEVYTALKAKVKAQHDEEVGRKTVVRPLVCRPEKAEWVAIRCGFLRKVFEESEILELLDKNSFLRAKQIKHRLFNGNRKE